MASKNLKSTSTNLATFWEVTVEGLPHGIEPSLSAWLFKQGCWGTQEKLSFRQPKLRYGPEIKKKKFISLSAYFAPHSREEIEWRVQKWLQYRAPMCRVQWNLQAQQDWLAEWKKHFKPFTLAGLKFVPAWEVSKILPRAKTVIVEPGMAFGTGTHSTTRFAIELLKRLSTKKKLKGAAVLDVGAGSGILSVVAERFGAKNVTAIDNDPEAWRECKKMFRLNKTVHCRGISLQLDEIKTPHDVVVANIIDGVLIDLKKHLIGATKPGGFLVLSGILTVGARAFIKSFLARTKCKVVIEISDDEWTSFLISKPR